MVNLYKAKLDIKSVSSGFKPFFVQYDHAGLAIELLDSGEPYDLTAAERVEFTHVRPDKMVIIQPGEIVRNDDKFFVYYEYLGTEMELLGKIQTSLAIFDIDDKKVSTFKFEVTIVEDLRDEVFNPAEPHVGVLTELLAEVQALKNGGGGGSGGSGPKGADGKTWHITATVPTNSLGAVGDMHLNTSTFDIREKTAALTWTVRGNIKGPQGEPGVGLKGDPGIKGIDGKMWHVTTTTPTNSLGAVGDMHLNTATYDIREKTGASTWTSRGNIKGAKGDTGERGLPGTGSAVTLNNTLTSNSTIEALTAAKGKELKDTIDHYFDHLDDVPAPVLDEAGASITVKNQTDCNNLLSSMRAVNSQTINVAFRGGRYFFDRLVLGTEFNNKTINFYNTSGENAEIFPVSDVYVPGDAVETTPTHYICNLKSTYLGNDSIVTDRGRIRVCDSRILTDVGVHYNDQENVETIDATNKIYRLKLPSELLFLKDKPLETVKRLYLWSSWHMFGSQITQITNDNYVYFTQNFTGTVNEDQGYIKRSARFYVTNFDDFLTDDTFLVKDGKVYIPKNCKYAIMAKKSTCFELRNTTAPITFLGLNFSGGLYDYNQHYRAAIETEEASNVTITKCTFNNVDSQAISVFGRGNGSTVPLTSKNIKISKNVFADMGAVVIEFFGEDISVVDNKIIRAGIIRMGGSTIGGSGVNFEVKRNYLYDFPYNGIALGRSRNESDYNIGVVQHNILHCDPTRNRSYDMADGGAIYTFTHNVDLVVKENVVYNIMGYNMRGIMGDDGNNGTRYERNLVFNIFGETSNNGIIAVNRWDTSTKNHLNNYFQHNLVFGNKISIGTLPNSNTRSDANIITTPVYIRDGQVIQVNPDITIQDFRIEENAVYLNRDIVLPFDVPEIFNPYLIFEEWGLKASNRGKFPYLLNNTDTELNIGNQTVASTFILHKYDMLSLSTQVVRSFSSSSLGQYTSLNLQLPWKLATLTSDCFINFKVDLFSQTANFRTSFEVTFATFKSNASSYQNEIFEISRVSPKINTVEMSLKATGYIDATGFFSILIEPLISGQSFISSTLFFIEIQDVKVFRKNDLTGEKGVLAINRTIPAGARTFGSYGIVGGRAPKNHLQQSVSYPDSSQVYITDTNQLAVRKNNKWYVQTATELT